MGDRKRLAGPTAAALRSAGAFEAVGNLRHLARGNIRQYGMIIALGAIIALFQILTKGVLLQPMNITNLVMQTSYIHIMSIGMMLVIICGYVDLSIGSVVAATGAISAVLILDNSIPVLWGILLILAVGVLIGSFHGFFISVINIPPFIVTLAGMLIFRGVCQVILTGQTKGPYPSAFQTMSIGFISLERGGRDIVSLIAGAAIIAALIFMEFRDRKSKKKYNLEVLPIYLSIAKVAIISLLVGFLAYALSSYNGIPVILCILLGLAVLYSFIMKNTIVGRHIYAVGGNQIAAKLSGINVAKIKFIVFANMGLLAALAGMVVAGRLNAATPRAGDGYELDAIAACYIGGASTSGGIGKIVGGIVGAMVMGVMNNGMSIMGLPIDWQRIIKGSVLLGAVCFDIYAKKKSTSA